MAKSNLTPGARTTIRDLSTRWKKFRDDSSTEFNKHFDNTFKYAEGLLEPGMTATKMVQEGVALVIGYLGGGRKIYQKAHKLYQD